MNRFDLDRYSFYWLVLVNTVMGFMACEIHGIPLQLLMIYFVGVGCRDMVMFSNFKQRYGVWLRMSFLISIRSLQSVLVYCKSYLARAAPLSKILGSHGREFEDGYILICCRVVWLIGSTEYE